MTDDVAPDLTQKALGFREFLTAYGMRGRVSISSVTLDPRLWPLSGRTSQPWSPGVNTARCLYHDHAAPFHDCACGLYARYEMPRSYRFKRGGIPAVVLSWGKTEVHPTDFRAEFSEIMLLGYHRRNRAEVQALARRYDVRAVPVKRLKREASKLRRVIPKELRPEPLVNVPPRRRPGLFLPVSWTCLGLAEEVTGVLTGSVTLLIEGGIMFLLVAALFVYRRFS